MYDRMHDLDLMTLTLPGLRSRSRSPDLKSWKFVHLQNLFHPPFKMKLTIDC